MFIKRFIGASICGCLLALLFITRGVTQPSQRMNETFFLDVSMIRLIAVPETYEGQRVRVIGYVNIEFEGNAVYLHEQDYKHAISKNGLWLDLPEAVRKNPKEYNRRYIVVEGTFTAKKQGHLGAYSGTISKITRFERSDY